MRKLWQKSPGCAIISPLLTAAFIYALFAVPGWEMKGIAWLALCMVIALAVRIARK